MNTGRLHSTEHNLGTNVAFPDSQLMGWSAAETGDLIHGILVCHVPEQDFSGVGFANGVGNLPSLIFWRQTWRKIDLEMPR